MAAEGPSRLKKAFIKVRDSGKTKDILVFLVFVCIAAVFWFILALNDDVQEGYDIPLEITDVPDSVTFISIPPAKLHVTVRDRGGNLLRNHVTGVPRLTLGFGEFADGDRFRVSHSSLSASLKRLFGASATVTSVAPDSLSLIFTRLPGKRVPLVLDYDVIAAPGMVLGEPKLSDVSVQVFSTDKTDTLRHILTEKVVLNNLDRNTTVDVPVRSVAGKRVVPSSVSVTFAVEPLVKKESEVPVVADNIPIGQDILFFPSRVRVTYYVPMSRYGDSADPIRVEASFNEAVLTSSDKVAVRVAGKAPYMSNVELLQDSVEYTLVRSN